MVQPSSQTLALAGPVGIARRPAVAAAVVAPMIASLTESLLVMASSLVCSEAASTTLKAKTRTLRTEFGSRVVSDWSHAHAGQAGRVSESPLATDWF